MFIRKSYVSAMLAAAAISTLHGADFVLVSDGSPAAEIVTQSNVSEHVKAFNDALKKCSGTELPMAEKRTQGKSSILFEVKDQTIDKDDAYIITFPDAATMKIICSPRSARWALNGILEKYVGVVRCFHTPRGSYYPQKKNIVIPVKEFRDDADYKLARFFTTEDPEWLCDVNGKELAPISFAAGHNVGLTILPPKKYAYGEWKNKIMPVKNGKRIDMPASETHGWQPCYSHPEAVTEAIRNIDDYLQKHPDQRIFSLTMNDLNNFCECENCIRANGGLKKINSRTHNWSDVYFKWCNAVAAGLEEKYPNVFFTTLAYCDAQNPPSFKLHPKITVLICTDLHAQMKKGRFENDVKLWEAWSKKASNLGIWEYGFAARDYSIPRLPWRLYARGLKTLKKNHGNLFFCESCPGIGEGPKRYLYMKLAWDVNADPEQIVSEWCEACVGKEAGKYLKQYYQWCHDFWTSDRVKQTPWYHTAGLYFLFSIGGTYVTALQKDDLANCRSLMDQMLSEARKSGDADQIYRAERIYRYYEFHEATALLAGGGILPLKRSAKIPGTAVPDVNTEEEAVYLAGKIPEIAEKIKKLPALMNELNNDGISGNFSIKQTAGNTLSEAFINPLFRWRNIPQVRAAIAQNLSRPGLTTEIRGQLQSILDFDKKASGGQELSDAAELALWDMSRSGLKVEIDRSTGKRRIKVTRKSGWCAAVRRLPDCMPGSSWAVEVTVSAPENAYVRNANARMLIQSAGNFQQNTASSESTEFYPLAIRKKVKMSLAVSFGANSYSQNIYVIWNGLPEGKHFYIEDIKFMELGNQAVPPGMKITSWQIPQKITSVKSAGSKVSTENLRKMVMVFSSEKITVKPGMKLLLTIPVRGEGVFLPRIRVTDANGTNLALLHGGRNITLKKTNEYKDARFLIKIPQTARFENAAYAEACVDLRSGNLEFDNVTLSILDQAK